MTPEDRLKQLLGDAGTDEVTEHEWDAFRSRAHRSLALRRASLAAGIVVLLGAGVAAGAALQRSPVAAPEPVDPAGTPGRPEKTRKQRPTATPSAALEPSYDVAYPDSDPTRVVQVFFLNGEQLVPDYREVSDVQVLGTMAMQALLDGPNGPEQEAGDSSTIPAGTRLLGLTIEDGVATVDLSREFQNTQLGTCCEHLPLAQVVWTLTQFRTVGSVVFEVEGEPIDMYGGHGIVIDGPQKRKDYEDAAPPIVVDSPFPGQIADSMFDLEGSANVFEANVSYRVVSNEDGSILAEGFATATCGTGCRGDYQTLVETFVEGETSARIEVFQASPEDGSPQHEVVIPINIVP